MGLLIDATLAVRAPSIASLTIPAIRLIHEAGIVGVTIVWMLLLVRVRRLLLVQVRLRLCALSRCLLLVLTNGVRSVMTTVVRIGRCSAGVAGHLTPALRVLAQVVSLRSIVAAKGTVGRVSFAVVLSTLLLCIIVV